MRRATRPLARIDHALGIGLTRAACGFPMRFIYLRIPAERRSMPRTKLLLGYGQLRAPILRPALLGVVRCEGALLSEALGRDSARSNPVAYKHGLYEIGAIQRKSVVALRVTGVVGVPG